MPKNDRFKGHTVIITGASSGIGRKTAELFLSEGAKIVVFDTDENGAASFISETDGVVRFFHVDVTSEDNVKDAVAAADKAFGSIDVLVNCAGVFAEGDVAGTDLETWRRILDVNLTGTFLCMKYALGTMLSRGSGNIVNIASEAGLAAIHGQAAYNVSKAAVIMLTKSAARDYAARGVRVNCVCPGRIMTPLVQKIIDASPSPRETFENLSYDRPMMRMGTTLDIANACLALASDEMPYATGCVMSVDGGYTL
ncbi:MAG: SDR family oxidoreductase [Synergistaceae bacterium]|jgi:NAD(P)-dependent dehydrogenase (short-subunit alcohol dehydrogenase family)|nr:SDR family oxidoreductase [Synergistaceae bacterium]